MSATTAGNDLARLLLGAAASYTEDKGGHTSSADRPIRLAQVDPAYTGIGMPGVIFDGETVMGAKTYPYLGARPEAGDRVALAPVGRSYLILGVVQTS
jgi:hypothetical protein